MLRFRSRVLRFRDLGASFSSFGCFVLRSSFSSASFSKLPELHIVSVTYENETISNKNSLPYLKCVLRLSCVVHGPIYGRFMGFYVNGFLSI